MSSSNGLGSSKLTPQQQASQRIAKNFHEAVAENARYVRKLILEAQQHAKKKQATPAQRKQAQRLLKLGDELATAVKAGKPTGQLEKSLVGALASVGVDASTLQEQVHHYVAELAKKPAPSA